MENVELGGRAVEMSRGKQQAYIDNVNLQRCYLHGPFNFTHHRKRTTQSHQIDQAHWQALIRAAEAHDSNFDADSALPDLSDLISYDLFYFDGSSGKTVEYTRFFGSESERVYSSRRTKLFVSG